MRIRNSESRIKVLFSFLTLLRERDKVRVDERGVAPILLIGGVIVVVAFVVFLYFMFNLNKSQQTDVLIIPPGVITDEQGIPCETQDAEFCHETPDIERWTDDGLP